MEHFKDYKELRAFLKAGRNFVEPERVGVVEKKIEEVKDEVSPKRSNRGRSKRNAEKDSNK